MKKLRLMRLTSLGLVVLSAAGRLWAADPWIGTWKYISSHTVFDPPPQIILTFHEGGVHWERMNAGGTKGERDEWTARLDGRDNPVTRVPAPGPFNQVVLDRLEKGLVEFTTKKDGNITGKQRIAASADGREMVLISIKDGNPIGLKNHWFRSGGGPDPAQPLAGQWTRDEDKNQAQIPEPPMTLAMDGDDGIRISQGDYMSNVARFDGKEYPVGNHPLFNIKSVVLKRVDQRTFEWTGKGIEGSVGTGRFAVSADGKTMTFTVTGLLQGGARVSSESKYRRQ